MINQKVPPPPVPILSIVNNHAATTSVEVARVFEKKHLHILRDIEGLEVPEDFRQSNFGLTSNDFKMPNGGVRKDKAYTMTRDGFTILAMGFTGAKAMKFKLAYIQAFNKMEAELTRQAQLASPGARLTPAQQRNIQKLISEKVYATCPKGRSPGVVFSHVYGKIKDRFQVGIYKDVPSGSFNDLVEMIQTMEIKIEPKQLPVPVKQDNATASPEEWMAVYDKLMATFGMVSIAVDRLHGYVKDLTKGRMQFSPDGRQDPLSCINGYYDELEKSAKKIQFLVMMLSWMSPRATIFNLSLDKPMK